MSGWIPLAWLQLAREPVRLCVALAGVAFAVILVFMQFGFQAALFESAVRIHQHLVADLVLFSPQSIYILEPKPMPRRRVYQAAAVDGVASATPVYFGRALWKHPITGKGRQILVIGFDPSRAVFDLPAVRAASTRLQLPDRFLFDRAARPEYGPVAALFDRGGSLDVEVNDRHTRVVGLFEIGTSFGIDGMLITSDLNLLRLFPGRQPGLMSLGLVRLAPGAHRETVRARLVQALPRDVLVLTKSEFIEREQQYWNATTPIGFVFAFGSIMGLVVGGVIVYQILFSDITSHLPEYATLKAMGYRNAHLFSVVLQEAMVLAVLGFLPGVAVAAWLYRLTAESTRLPMTLTGAGVATVFGLTTVMCVVAGAIALRKVRSADPAEIF